MPNTKRRTRPLEETQRSRRTKPKPTPLESALLAIAEDAYIEPEFYLEETLVPGGGE